MIPGEAIEAAANAISQASGMRFDGFWTRVEDLEPEDREYALREAEAAIAAALPHVWDAIADAWDAGANAADGKWLVLQHNPYRRAK